jgi:hypothetical protein
MSYSGSRPYRDLDFLWAALTIERTEISGRHDAAASVRELGKTEKLKRGQSLGQSSKGVLPNWTLRREALIDFSPAAAHARQDKRRSIR